MGEVQAKKWPEGITVLIVDPTRLNDIKLCGWFRPDWVGKSGGYGISSRLFLKITE